MNAQLQWWESFFEGVSVDLWLQAIPPAASATETDRLEQLLSLAPGAHLLDVPCGAGRIALNLAQRGYAITGVDWSREFLDHARRSAFGDRVNWEQRDMRDLPWRERFDGAFSVGNSFGYLDDEGNAAFLTAVRRTLKRGARFVLDTPMVLENLLPHLEPRPWWKAGDIRLLAENRYTPETGRLDIEYTFVRDGAVDVRRGSHRAYTYRELVGLMTEAGFSVTTAEPWSGDARSVTFVGTAI